MQVVLVTTWKWMMWIRSWDCVDKWWLRWENVSVMIVMIAALVLNTSSQTSDLRCRISHSPPLKIIISRNQLQSAAAEVSSAAKANVPLSMSRRVIVSDPIFIIRCLNSTSVGWDMMRLWWALMSAATYHPHSSSHLQPQSPALTSHIQTVTCIACKEMLTL